MIDLLYYEFEKRKTTILESYPKNKTQYLNVLENTTADGTILLNNIKSIEDGLTLSLKIYSRSKPLIFLSSYLAGHDPEFHSVRADNIHAGYTAAGYLFKRGVKKIFFINPGEKNTIFSERYLGCVKASGDFPSKELSLIDFSALHGAAGPLHDELKSALSEKTCGFICATDGTAFLFDKYLREKGLRNSLEVPLLGIDGCYKMEENDIRTASVKIDLKSMAANAVELFYKLLENKVTVTQRILTGCSITENDSIVNTN